MKLMFVHNKGFLADLNKRRSDALERILLINKDKKAILDRFTEDMKGDNFDAGTVFYRDIMPKMASFGGRVSGESRRFKSDLIMYILLCLSTNKDNALIFDYFTSMNYAVFAKKIFNSSPTKSDILPLLFHGGGNMTWQKKNEFYNEFSRKDKFLKYCKSEFTPEDVEEFATFFNDQYDSYKAIVSEQNKISKSVITGIKSQIKKGDQLNLLD